MSLESIEGAYGSVAEYNRRQDEKEYGSGYNRENLVSNTDFNKYFYDCIDKKLDSLQSQLREFEMALYFIHYNYDNMLMEDPWMPDDTVDAEMETAKNRVLHLYDSTKDEYDKTVNSLVRSTNMQDRIYAAHKGFEPERLARDTSLEVRIAVAETGKCHDILYKDKKVDVRRKVAEITEDTNILSSLMEDDDISVKRIASRKLDTNEKTDVSNETYDYDSVNPAIIVPPNTIIENLDSVPDFYTSGKQLFLKNHPDVSEEVYDKTVEVVYSVPTTEELINDIISTCQRYAPITNSPTFDEDGSPDFAKIEYGLLRMILYQDSLDVADGKAKDYTGLNPSDKARGDWTYAVDVYVGRSPSEEEIWHKEADDVQIATITLVSRDGKFDIPENINNIRSVFDEDAAVKKDIFSVYEFEKARHEEAMSKELEGRKDLEYDY